MESALQELGRRIRNLRTERGWSQERFAEICGVHRTYMGHIERGEKNLSFNTLVRLSEGLGVGLAELLSDAAPAASGERRSPPSGSRRKKMNPKDLGTIVRELKHQREVLTGTADLLKDAANALAVYRKRPAKR